MVPVWATAAAGISFPLCRVRKRRRRSAQHSACCAGPRPPAAAAVLSSPTGGTKGGVSAPEFSRLRLDVPGGTSDETFYYSRTISGLAYVVDFPPSVDCTIRTASSGRLSVSPWYPCPASCTIAGGTTAHASDCGESSTLPAPTGAEAWARSPGRLQQSQDFVVSGHPESPFLKTVCSPRVCFPTLLGGSPPVPKPKTLRVTRTIFLSTVS